MKRILILVFFSLCITAGDIFAQTPALPPPPPGYVWAECPEIKGAFLKPKDWHFKSSKKGDTRGFFITKEALGTNSQFTTGMTVNVVPNIPKKKDMSPYDFALRYREAARSTVTFAKEWNKNLGPFKSVGFVYSKDDKDGAFTVHTLLIANNKTGTLYMVLFEGPAAQWTEIWKTAEPMLQYLLIDDTI